MINLYFYKTGDGTKQFWGDELSRCGIENLILCSFCMFLFIVHSSRYLSPQIFQIVFFFVN